MLGVSGKCNKKKRVRVGGVNVLVRSADVSECL